ncbi:MAG: GNAT family N-acetyltransferase [Clostridia bacterium]|jgi:predicted GNAT family N-acyltransferase|nr:GNAT family N-acetyltransferase [Clostridia bacterium]
MQIKRVKTREELKVVFNIRKAVFVLEQGVPIEDEFDEHEDYAEHVLVYYNNKPAGTGRLREVDGAGKLERICVLASYRKLGLGKIIVTSLEKIAHDKDLQRVKLHGQTQAEEFYTRLGYQRSSDIFIEDGIPHVLMTKIL